MQKDLDLRESLLDRTRVRNLEDVLDKNLSIGFENYCIRYAAKCNVQRKFVGWQTEKTANKLATTYNNSFGVTAEASRKLTFGSKNEDG